MIFGLILMVLLLHRELLVRKERKAYKVVKALLAQELKVRPDRKEFKGLQKRKRQRNSRSHQIFVSKKTFMHIMKELKSY